MQRPVLLAALLLAASPLPAETPAGLRALASGVLEIFQRRCAECHGHDAATPKKFQIIDDLARLRASTYVKLNDPENSDLYQSVVTLDMPRRTKADKMGDREPEPLKPEEVALILGWIKAGAPDGQSVASAAKAAKFTPSNNSVKLPPPPVSARGLVTNAELLNGALRDLLTQTEEDRSDIRYVSIAPEHNNTAEVRARTWSAWRISPTSEQNNTAEVRDDQLERMRNGVRKMLNSLSSNPRIAKFVETGPRKVLFRVKLSDLGWDGALWDHVASFYPYALENSGAVALGDACHTTVPILRADWLAANATRPPLYYDILHIPATSQALERKLGVDLPNLQKEGHAIRVAFNKSGISLANRMIERVETLAYPGAYWKSYDFRQNTGKGRLNDFPLGPVDAHLAGGHHAFEHAGGEIVFSLPNGLHGYMLTDAVGHRLDGNAPTNIVGDREGKVVGRVEISSGLSCIVCHERGIKLPVPPDEIRAGAGSASFSAEEQRLIEHLYSERKVTEEALKNDEDRFMAALKEAGVEQTADREPVLALAERFELPVTLAEAAAELGLNVTDFDEKAKISSALFDIHTQLAGAGIPRDAFATKFAELVLRLNLGNVHSAALLVVPSAPVKNQPQAVPLSVTLRTDKATYANGEKLVACVQAAQDCYLRLLYKDAAGKIILLFPNKIHPDGRIPGAQEVQIPSVSDGFDIEIEAPNGAESLAAIVSSQPFTDEPRFQQILASATDSSKAFVDFEDKDLEVVVAKSARVRAREARLGIARLNLSTHP